jgi:hypothetical protein
VAAQQLHIERGAALTKLVRYSITYAQEFNVRSYIGDFANYLLAKVYSCWAWQCGQRDARVEA